jgi:cytochrome c553
MYRVRLFVLWVMMIAVPFQGYAAVAMVFCGPDHGGAPAAATAAAEHKHGDGHADHHHAKAQDEAKQSAGHSADKTASAEPDAMHKCSTCGTCGACHGTALISTLEFPVLHGLPRADLAEPPFAMATLAPRVLDKPPRA